MKLTYLHYYLKPRGSRNATRLRCDLRPLVDRYVVAPDSHQREPREGEDGETPYLLRTGAQTQEVYLFVCTRDRDIIKTINAHTFDCADIRTKLEREEHIGFASYVFVGPDFLALASTNRGPKITTFAKLVADMVSLQTGRQLVFKSETLDATLTREAAMHFESVSNVTLTLDRSNDVFQGIRSLFGRDNFGYTDSIEVTFRPARGRRQNELLPEVFEAIPEDAPGLKKFMIRGKAALDDDMMDFYLTCQGKIKDEISQGTEMEIIQQIAQKCRNNEAVVGKIRAIQQREHYEDYRMPDSVDSDDNGGGDSPSVGA